MFSIDSDLSITSYQGTAPSKEDVISFSDQRGLAKATATWTTPQYVELWNSFAGSPPFGNLRQVKKFTDRNTAIKRIWDVLSTAWPTADPLQTKTLSFAEEALIATDQTTIPKAAKKASVRAQAPSEAKTTAKAATTTTPSTKAGRRETIMALISREGGSTLAEIMQTTGWQAHSVRGFIATLHTKHGVHVASRKNEAGQRVYQAATA